MEDLRKKNNDFITKVFEYIDKKNQYLADIIIMSWSLPRSDTYLSKKFYHNKYKNNIKKFNHKLFEIVDHYVIKNFCVETLTKTNFVPVHCIDILWFYMNHLSFEFNFYSTNNCYYLGFIMPEERGTYDEYIEFGLNAAFILDMGLGNINDSIKGTFKNFIKKIFTDYNIIKKYLSTKNSKNFFVQLKNINTNFPNYFNNEKSPFSNYDLEKISKNI